MLSHPSLETRSNESSMRLLYAGVPDLRVLLLQLLEALVDIYSRMGAMQEPLDFQTILHSVRGAMLDAQVIIDPDMPTTCSSAYQQPQPLHSCKFVRWHTQQSASQVCAQTRLTLRCFSPPCSSIPTTVARTRRSSGRSPTAGRPVPTPLRAAPTTSPTTIA